MTSNPDNQSQVNLDLLFKAERDARVVLTCHEENLSTAFGKWELWPCPSSKHRLVVARRELVKASHRLVAIRKEIKALWKTPVKKKKKGLTDPTG